MISITKKRSHQGERPSRNASPLNIFEWNKSSKLCHMKFWSEKSFQLYIVGSFVVCPFPPKSYLSTDLYGKSTTGFTLNSKVYPSKKTQTRRLQCNFLDILPLLLLFVSFFNRKDMELDGNRALIGIATSSGTCNLPRQCLLCEEYGPSAGLVLAHEIGHT